MQMFVSRSKFILEIPIILVSILQCSSAGTMSQRQLAADGKYENKIYAASRWSLKTIFDEVGAHDLSPLCIGGIIGTISLPFSLVYDTLALPYTVPHYAFDNFEEDPQVRIYNEVTDGNIDEVRENLDEGAKVNYQYGNPRVFSTLLCRAIASEDSGMVSLLIHSGADVNQTCESGIRAGNYTPLEIAEMYAGSEAAQMKSILKANGAKD